jgi:hypothetical protein
MIGASAPVHALRVQHGVGRPRSIAQQIGEHACVWRRRGAAADDRAA